jgi:DNA-binding NarL/FixJ family response regulator
MLASMLRSTVGGDTGAMSVEPQSVAPQAIALRLVIVDDNVHFLEAARTVLQDDGIDVVGVARTSAEALRNAAALQPDVILVDVDLGEESGLDLAQELAASGHARIVLISAYPESELADLIATSPALGFVPKSQLSARAVVRLLGDEVR